VDVPALHILKYEPAATIMEAVAACNVTEGIIVPLLLIVNSPVIIDHIPVPVPATWEGCWVAVCILYAPFMAAAPDKLVTSNPIFTKWQDVVVAVPNPFTSNKALPEDADICVNENIQSKKYLVLACTVKAPLGEALNNFCNEPVLVIMMFLL